MRIEIAFAATQHKGRIRLTIVADYRNMMRRLRQIDLKLGPICRRCIELLVYEHYTQPMRKRHSRMRTSSTISVW
jgi:hypothetical protein